MRRVTLVLARMVAVCMVLQAAATAAAQPRPAEVAAETRRAEVLARAAQLTVAQARTVFAQMTPAPFGPTIHDVVVDTRPDGTRNVFGLMDVDPRRECSIQGFPVSDCGDKGPQTWVFFTQLHADGRVLQTGFDLPFAVIPRSAPSTSRAVGLRLFAPASPSDPKVVLIDGVRAGRQSYGHSIWLWDGRGGYGVPGASSLIERGANSGGAELMSVAVDEAGQRVVVTSLECARGCSCTIPRTPADEAAQLARLVQRQPTACIPRERVFPFPAGLHLIDEDLDARAPTGTEAEIVAAVAPDLARASGLTRPQAEAAIALLGRAHLFAPRFSGFVSATNADRSRAVYGIVEMRWYDLCVVRRRQSLYDAARACAHESMASNRLLSIAVSTGGEVTAARLTDVPGGTIRLHLTRDASGAVVPVVEAWRAPGYNLQAFRHEVRILDGAGIGRIEFVTDSHFVGELLARPAGAPFVTLTRRRSACSRSCPCEPMPQSPTEERAFLTARANARAAACPVEEAPFPAPP